MNPGLLGEKCERYLCAMPLPVYDQCKNVSFNLFCFKITFCLLQKKRATQEFCNKSISEKKLKASFLFLFSGGLSIKVYRGKVIRKSWWNCFKNSLHSFDVIGSKPLLECCHHSPDEMHPWLLKACGKYAQSKICIIWAPIGATLTLSA